MHCGRKVVESSGCKCCKHGPVSCPIVYQRNWGLTPTEVTTLPPALARSFTKNVSGGFGSDMGGDWGPLLLRGSLNAQLYGPLQEEWLKGKERGSDIWIHKNKCEDRLRGDNVISQGTFLQNGRFMGIRNFFGFILKRRRDQNALFCRC